MAFGHSDPRVGLPAITDHTTPATVETIGSTTVYDIPVPLGTIVKASDPTYGQGEFIRLIGVANTVANLMVTYSKSTFQTAIMSDTANLSMPVAVAKSACVAGEHGWYQISGMTPVLKTNVKADPAVAGNRVFLSATIGRVMQTSTAGKQILGAMRANVATVTSTTSTVVLQLSRPHAQGQIV